MPNYIGLSYAEDQAGYLAGIVAAAATGADIIGAIGGMSLCGPCIRYIQGYELGAKSVNPDITVKAAWVSDSDFRLGFNDQAAGKTFGQQFITQNAGIDVLFQVAGLTGNGVLDAACEAGINAIGVDVDQYLSYPALAGVHRDQRREEAGELGVADDRGIADGSATGGQTTVRRGQRRHRRVAPFYDAGASSPRTPRRSVDAALAAMEAGTLVTCPADTCGSQDGLADAG